MDLIATLGPHGRREEWLLLAIGVLITILLMVGVRLGAPRRRIPRHAAFQQLVKRQLKLESRADNERTLPIDNPKGDDN